jgi:hypothetical protein
MAQEEEREPVTMRVVHSYFYFLFFYGMMLFAKTISNLPKVPTTTARQKKEINFRWEMLLRYLVFFTFMGNFLKPNSRKSPISSPVVHFQMIPVYL